MMVPAGQANIFVTLVDDAYLGNKIIDVFLWIDGLTMVTTTEGKGQ